MGYAEFHAETRRKIREYGHTVLQIFGDEETNSLPFSYTIGLHEAGLPELYVAGFIGEAVHAAMNAIADELRKRGSRFDDGERVDYGAIYPVLIVNSPSCRANMHQARNILGVDDFDVQQLIFADKTGKFPDDEGCEPYFITAQRPPKLN